MLRIAIIAFLATLSVFSSAFAGTLRMAHDYGFGANTTMDPYDPNRFWPTINLVFDALVTLDPQGVPEPRLAVSWTSSPDLTQWTFRLRPDVSFHDGSTLDAGDVVFSFNRMIDAKKDYPVRAVLGIIKSVEAVDPLTVHFVLASAEADFPALVGDYRALILPEGTSDEAVASTPVGTGPFRLETLSAEGTTRLVPFEAYYLGKPMLDGIDMIAIPDSSARIQALMSGQIDMLLSIDPKQAPLFANNQQFTLQTIPSGDWNAIAFQTNAKPFDDPRVRKALRIAVDRKALTTLLLGAGNGVVSCDTPVWSGDANRLDMDCPQDIAGAKALLAEAGYPDGIDIDIATSDVEENMVQLVEAYQAQVAPAGIRVRLVMTASDGYWDNVWMKVPAFVDSWGQRPATQVLNEAYRSTAAWNATVWKRRDFDALLDKARGEADAGKRKALYGEAQKMLFEEGGNFIPYHKVLLRVLRTGIGGIETPFVTENIAWHLVSLN